MRESGRLDDPSPVKPEVQNKGQPEICIAGAAGGKRERLGQPGTLLKPAPSKAWEVRGNLNGTSPAQPKTRERGGNPKDSDAGSAKRERDTGQPGKRNPGWAGRSRFAANPQPIDRLKRSMHDPMSYKITREAPGAARSPGVFVFGVIYQP